MTHGNPWGVPWDPGVGTMGAPWVGSLSLLGLKGPLGLLGPWASWALGPLGPQGLIGPQGLMAPQGTQGSGVMAWTLAGAMGSHRVLRIKYALMQLHY